MSDPRTLLWMLALRLQLLKEWEERSLRLIEETIKVTKDERGALRVTWQWEPPPFEP